jgi:L-ascorbate peroxidase
VTQPNNADDAGREASVVDYIASLMLVEEAPAFLRLAFHDAGTYDVRTHSGGAHGAIHLIAELSRPENVGMTSCVGLLQRIKGAFPELSWADLVALGGAAAVAKCGGPTIRIGLGRVDAPEPAPDHRLPTTDEGAAKLKVHFARMGLGPRDLVALSGGHTLGQAGGRAFTADPYRFSNSYYQALLAKDEVADSGLLPSDRALLDDPELRHYVEAYAADAALFTSDFSAAYRRLTWLGKEDG